MTAHPETRSTTTETRSPAMTNQPRTARPRKMVRRSILLAVAVIAATFGIGLAEPEAERAVDAAPQAAAATVTHSRVRSKR